MAPAAAAAATKHAARFDSETTLPAPASAAAESRPHPAALLVTPPAALALAEASAPCLSSSLLLPGTGEQQCATCELDKLQVVPRSSRTLPRAVSLRIAEDSEACRPSCASWYADSRARLHVRFSNLKRRAARRIRLGIHVGRTHAATPFAERRTRWRTRRTRNTMRIPQAQRVRGELW